MGSNHFQMPWSLASHFGVRNVFPLTSACAARIVCASSSVPDADEPSTGTQGARLNPAFASLKFMVFSPAQNADNGTNVSTRATAISLRMLSAADIEVRLERLER